MTNANIRGFIDAEILKSQEAVKRASDRIEASYPYSAEYHMGREDYNYAQGELSTLRYVRGHFCSGDASSASSSRRDEAIAKLKELESAENETAHQGADEVLLDYLRDQGDDGKAVADAWVKTCQAVEFCWA